MIKIGKQHINLFSLLRHFGFWVIFILINWSMSSTELSYLAFINYHLVYFLVSFTFFYTHYFILGYALIRKRYSIYRLLLTSLMEIVCFSFILESVLYFEIDHATPDYQFTIVEFSLDLYFTTLMIIGASLYYLIKDHLINKQRLMALEIQFLKDQIKPHYFNNELNILLGLISKDEIEKSKDYIKDLSEYLVYSLKHDMNEYSLLRDEINGIFSYLDNLERRSEFELNIDYSVQGQVGELKIHPLILITFIENAIKYSEIEEKKDAFLSIAIEVKGKDVNFVIKNSISQQISDTKVSLGIGLKNVKRRLDLQYKNHHELNITRTANAFEIQLNLTLV